MKSISLFLIRAYRTIASPVLAPSCRFSPSCSHYAEQAVAQKGAWQGLHLTFLRLIKCHPFHAGGYDPVE